MSKVEEQIRRAMQAGQFENLPGKGRPLRLEKDPFADPEWQLAHHMLRNAGFTLPWIELRREIESELEAARAALARAWAWRRSALVGKKESASFVEGEWSRAKDDFQQKIAALNRRILSYNVQVPAERLQLYPLSIERELETICENR
jgi:DnaJ family protein C protein 28